MGTIRVRLTPSAGVERVAIDDDGNVKVWVKAPPIEGRANRRLVEFLSHALGVPKSRVYVARGAGTRIKTIGVEGMERSQVLEALARAGEV